MVSIEHILSLGLAVAILTALARYSHTTLMTVAEHLRTLLAG